MDHVAAVSDLTEKLFRTVPGHHGWEHISRVVSYTRRALETEPTLTSDQQAVVIVAALLHDADDPKVYLKEIGKGRKKFEKERNF